MKKFLSRNTLVHINQNFLIQITRKVTSKMKDQYKRTPINKFVGLKSKMYSILSENSKESSKAKRVIIALSLTNTRKFCLKSK